MTSLVANYEEQRVAMARVELYASLQDGPCEYCPAMRREHVKLAAGIEVCPTSFYKARTVVQAKPSGEIGRVNWFGIGYGIAAGLYVLALGAFVVWMLS